MTLGLCSQIDLDFEVQRAAKDRPHVGDRRRARPCMPAEVTTAPEPARAEPSPTGRPPAQSEEAIDVDSVFAKLKQLKRSPDEDDEE